MKKMYLRQDHVLVLKPKSLLLSRVIFLLLVFLPSLIELNNNKKKATKLWRPPAQWKKENVSQGFQFSSLSVLESRCGKPSRAENVFEGWKESFDATAVALFYPNQTTIFLHED